MNTPTAPSAMVSNLILMSLPFWNVKLDCECVQRARSRAGKTPGSALPLRPSPAQPEVTFPALYLFLTLAAQGVEAF